MVDPELSALVAALSKGDFITAIGPEKAHRLYQLAYTQGIPAGGFIVNLPLTEGGHASFLYEIVQPTKFFDRIFRRGRIALRHTQVIMPSRAGEVVALPEEWQKFPIWWLD